MSKTSAEVNKLKAPASGRRRFQEAEAFFLRRTLAALLGLRILHKSHKKQDPSRRIFLTWLGAPVYVIEKEEGEILSQRPRQPYPISGVPTPKSKASKSSFPGRFLWKTE
jgi:hypothetical protein